jgi:hypothetical protein
LAKKAIGIFLPSHHSRMIFFSFVSLKKISLKNVTLGVSKIIFLGATLNLHRGKTVKLFYTFSSPDDTHGQGLSNKKTELSIMPVS